MLFKLIVPLVRIKLKEQLFKLCSGNMQEFYFQKHYCTLLSLNNIHIGAKLNRNSNYNQNHQEKDLKIRKLEIFFSVEAARLRFWPAAGSLTPSWAFGPTANDRAAKPARLGSPSFPSRAASRPTSRPGAARHRIPIRRPSGHFGVPKPAGAGAPPKP